MSSRGGEESLLLGMSDSNVIMINVSPILNSNNYLDPASSYATLFSVSSALQAVDASLPDKNRYYKNSNSPLVSVAEPKHPK